MANNELFEQAKLKFKFILMSELTRDPVGLNYLFIKKKNKNNQYMDSDIPGLVNLRKKQQKINDEIKNLQYDWILKESKDDEALFFYLTFYIYFYSQNIQEFITPGLTNRIMENYNIRRRCRNSEIYNIFERDVELLKQHFTRRVAMYINYNRFGKTMKLLKNKYSNTRLRSEARKCKNANETRQKAIRIMQNAKVLPY